MVARAGGHGEVGIQRLRLVAGNVKDHIQRPAGQQGRVEFSIAAHPQVGFDVVGDGGGVDKALGGTHHAVWIAHLGIQADGRGVPDVGMEAVLQRVAAGAGVQRALKQVVHAVAIRVGGQGVAVDADALALGVGECPAVHDLGVIANPVAVGVGVVGVGAQAGFLAVGETVAVGVGVAWVKELAPLVDREGTALQFPGVREAVAVGIPGGVVGVIAAVGLGQQAIAVGVAEDHTIGPPGHVDELVQRLGQHVEHDRTDGT